MRTIFNIVKALFEHDDKKAESTEDLLAEAMARIDRDAGGRCGVVGVVVCPRCGGELGYTVDPKARVIAACRTTEPCLWVWGRRRSPK